MDIQLGILGSETTFEYAIVEYEYQIQGQVNVTPSGNKRIQYAKNDKYIFRIKLNYVYDDVWDDLASEIENSKTNDLNLIIGEDNYTVRFQPENIPKKPILGTALGYNIEFTLIEV
ncbi:MAG: hypothetical protein DRZ76_02110 [Candidatus Nealsonbacteria bacterium]|nr:MAG: hypothetical protein DRZ76_02110 [Candidatus Nealsonbacteria bacterium]